MEKYVDVLLERLKADEPELLAKIYKTYLVNPVAATEFVETCLTRALVDADAKLEEV